MSVFDHLPKLIAHRGLSSIAPENTHAAIQLAAAKGSTWVEIDVNTSADGVPYLHHDDTLDRCTNGQGLLIEQDASDLDKLDAGSWFDKSFGNEKLLSLEGFMNLAEDYRLGVNLEIKPTQGNEQETARIICEIVKSDWPSSCPLLISSFSEKALITARRILPHQALGYLTGSIPQSWKDKMVDLDCQSFHAAWQGFDETIVTQIKALGYPVLAYTVDDDKIAKQLYDIGVDSLFSNRPIELAKELAIG